MLVLTRGENQDIILSHNNTYEVIAVIKVVAIRGNQIQIGIAAHTDIAIDREEIYKRKLLEGKQEKQNGRV